MKFYLRIYENMHCMKDLFICLRTQTHNPFFFFLAPHHRQNCNVTLNMKMLISDGTSLPQCRHVSCPALFLSRLISSNLPHSSPLPVIPPLHRSQMPLLCSAVWHLQSDSFTPLLSPQGYYIPSQSCTHTHTHTHTTIETSTQHL